MQERAVHGGRWERLELDHLLPVFGWWARTGELGMRWQWVDGWMELMDSGDCVRWAANFLVQVAWGEEELKN